jgi:hypothetical protein
MTTELNTKREHIYTVIVILIFVSTNIYFYLVDPPSIFEFLGIELVYLLIFGLYELFILWLNTKYKQNVLGYFEKYWVLYILILIQIMPGILMVVLGETNLSSLQTPLVGISVMVIWFLLARAIVRQVQFALLFPEKQGTPQQTSGM